MRVSEKVAQQLQRMICQTNLKIGDRLPSERQLCEQFQVSRSSLREAIQQLNAQGILESRIGDGTYIQQLPKQNSSTATENSLLLQPIIPVELFSDLIHQDASYRFDVQEARLILESGTAYYAAERATEQDKAKIRYYYEQISHYQALGDNEQAAIQDANFHLAIAEASHNLVLIQMMKELFDLLQFNILLGRRKVYTEPTRFDQLHQQHFDVMTAIEQKNAIEARNNVCHHIEFVIQQVRSIDEAEARRKRAYRLWQEI
ncbi:FCD domain-containing protein [Moraxella sp. ZY210820]|uniref:FCD domain-containing protein n=1 Tax=unclassified Moraxella TaxID=2685852 RepID=UPI0027305A99|nr:FCD domain-containing protein [Moraxella sp. ZY210820]WLF82918.1 FCD domain-containing protein [Moraxella sp. ZY210820]